MERLSLSIGGDTEAAIMDVAWSAGRPLTVRVIWAALNAGRGRRALAYTTVLTVVTNLADKGLLLRDTQRRAYQYEAAVSREEFIASRMTQALGETTDRTAVLLQLLGKLSDEERAAMVTYARRLRRHR